MSVQALNTDGYRDEHSRIQHADVWTTKANGDQHRRKEGHANSLNRLLYYYICNFLFMRVGIKIVFTRFCNNYFHSSEEVENLYEALEELIDKEKGKDYLVVMGDWNAVVGEG